MLKSESVKAKASSKFVSMSPYKVRRVLDQIRGRSYQEALRLLEFMPYRACDPVLKVLISAAANAKHTAAKQKLNFQKSTLYISEARADQGPKMKRFRPRAKGRGFAIEKLSCHILISVEDTNTHVSAV